MSDDLRILSNSFECCGKQTLSAKFVQAGACARATESMDAFKRDLATVKACPLPQRQAPGHVHQGGQLCVEKGTNLPCNEEPPMRSHEHMRMHTGICWAIPHLPNPSIDDKVLAAELLPIQFFDGFGNFLP
eukprot:3561176-Amphidinium_carterae.1